MQVTLLHAFVAYNLFLTIKPAPSSSLEPSHCCLSSSALTSMPCSPLSLHRHLLPLLPLFLFSLFLSSIYPPPSSSSSPLPCVLSIRKMEKLNAFHVHWEKNGGSSTVMLLNSTHGRAIKLRPFFVAYVAMASAPMRSCKYISQMVTPSLMIKLCSDVDENAACASAQYVRAPIYDFFADDAPLLPLDPKTDTHAAIWTHDLVSTLEVTSGAAARDACDGATNAYNLGSVLTIAFQFTYEKRLRENVAAMAWQYLQNVVASVQRVGMAIGPSRLASQIGVKHPPGSPEALTLAQWISQSYRFHTGVELLRGDPHAGDSLLKLLWHHSDAITCCCLKICERSLTPATSGPAGPSSPNFGRAEMLPSGNLIRPCEGGASMIHIVDHVDLDAWSVPEVLRPLYESPKIVAQKMTMAALRHIRQIALESSGEIVYGGGRQPAVLRTFSQRLSRGFNDVVNGFTEDGWSLMSSDGIEDFLEVIRLKGHGFPQDDVVLSRAMYLLQLGSGVDENVAGACAQLVFAPIDESFADDAPLPPSGFRVIPLDPKTDTHAATRTLDLASTLEVGSGAAARAACDSATNAYNLRFLTIAFQFTYENHLRENVAAMTRQYVRSVVASVQRVAMAISPSRLASQIGVKHPPGSPEALTLAQWMSRSYRFHTGVELLQADPQAGDSLLKLLWHHSDAIMCCSLKASPVFTFANQAGLDMLETTLVALQDITLETILDDAGCKVLCSEFPKIMQQGFAYLPAGICMSSMGRLLSYEQAVAWKVLNEEDTHHCLAFMFVNWSFI